MLSFKGLCTSSIKSLQTWINSVWPWPFTSVIGVDVMFDFWLTTRTYGGRSSSCAHPFLTSTQGQPPPPPPHCLLIKVPPVIKTLPLETGKNATRGFYSSPVRQLELLWSGESLPIAFSHIGGQVDTPESISFSRYLVLYEKNPPSSLLFHIRGKTDINIPWFRWVLFLFFFCGKQGVAGDEG